MELTMRNFITEQPETLQRVIDHAPAEVEKALCRLNGLVKRIFMVGSGTSLNAALAAKYVMEYYNDCEVQVIPPLIFFIIFHKRGFLGIPGNWYIPNCPKHWCNRRD